MQTLFIADLHLSDHTPDLNDLFAQFLRDHAHSTNALYILGDLFEAWTGDDDDSPTASHIAAQIRQFSRYAPVYFIAGNRDFMIGHAYAARANMTLLPENHMITLHGKHVLLTHGDEMCTDDVQYLRYRAVIRQRWLQKILLLLPFKKRKKIAERIREKSRARKKGYDAITDVTEMGMEAACAKNRALDIIVHGHTHRKNIHTHQIVGKERIRYVLPDWFDGKGGYLAVNEQGWVFHDLPESAVQAA